MQFTKMQGLGNDFVFVEENQVSRVPDLSVFAQAVCDRHFGVGADGLVIVCSSENADLKMRMFNPDGTEAEMCGNAIRCFAKYSFERDIVKKHVMTVETLAGFMVPELILDEGRVVAVKVDMGEPRLSPAGIPVKMDGEKVVSRLLNVGDKEFTVTCLSMGNPHCVIFVSDIEKVPVGDWGPLISEHPVFPEKTNVEFVQVIRREQISMRVWERGAGETLACGTGACASAVAAQLNGKIESTVTVSLLGGEMMIEWNAEDNHVYMTGPAEEVFVGDIEV